MVPSSKWTDEVPGVVSKHNEDNYLQKAFQSDVHLSSVKEKKPDQLLYVPRPMRLNEDHLENSKLNETHKKCFNVTTSSENFCADCFQNFSPDVTTQDSLETSCNDDGDNDDADAEISKQLSAMISDAQPVFARNDYSEYKSDKDYKGNTKSDEEFDEYNQIVELFGFPKEFTTKDLVASLSSFKWPCDFTIKWVDDCHALGVFTNISAAKQAIEMKHLFVKVRPLSQATNESKKKAKSLYDISVSSKPRPQTSVILAHRLVTGALGLRPDISKDQRERLKLQEEKERRQNTTKNARKGNDT